MPLPANLHALVPSSTPGILLEARLYLFPCPQRLAEQLLYSPSDQLPRTEQISDEIVAGLKQFGARRLVVASHPWGRLGGTQLDPVLTTHLLTAVKRHSVHHRLPTAVVTYNVRGVGNSHGSSALVTAGPDPEDYAAVQKWAVNILGGSVVVKEVKRLGYSWGCISATIAPVNYAQAPPIRSVLLIAPPLAFLPGVTWFSKNTFATAITSLTSSLPQALEGSDTVTGPAKAHKHFRDTSLSLDSSAIATSPTSPSSPGADRDDAATSSDAIQGAGTNTDPGLKRHKRRSSRISTSSTSSRSSFPPSPVLDSTTATLPAPSSGSMPRDQDTDPSDLSPPSSRQGGPPGCDARVWTIWGSSDQFTGPSRFQGWVQKNAGIRWKEVQGDHFWQWDLQAGELRGWMEEWLDA